MGSGFWRRLGEKNCEGSGSTEDCVWGKRKWVVGSLRIGSGGGGGMVGGSGCGGGGL